MNLHLVHCAECGKPIDRGQKSGSSIKPLEISVKQGKKILFFCGHYHRHLYIESEKVDYLKEG
jgi:hypothetical protein